MLCRAYLGIYKVNCQMEATLLLHMGYTNRYVGIYVGFRDLEGPVHNGASTGTENGKGHGNWDLHSIVAVMLQG